MINVKRCPFRQEVEIKDGVVVEPAKHFIEFGVCYEDACPYYDHDNSYHFSKKSYCKKVQIELATETKFLEQFGRFGE